MIIGFILIIFVMILILGSCMIENSQLHDRIDKVIKYIIECTYDDCTLEYCDKDDILKILYGEK